MFSMDSLEVNRSTFVVPFAQYGDASRVLYHRDAPAFGATIQRDVWRVFGDTSGEGGGAPTPRYCAVYVESTTEGDALDCREVRRQRIAPISASKVDLLLNRLRQVHVTSLCDLRAACIDGRIQELALGGAYGVQFRWCCDPPDGMSELVAVVEDFLIQIDRAVGVLS